MISLLSILLWLDDIIRGRQRCGSAECMAPALARIYWPGRDPMPACERHRAWAQHVASALGFNLHWSEIPQPEERPDPAALRFSHLEID